MNFLYSIMIVSILGGVLGVLLALASKYLSVPKDEKIETVTALLPGANCGGCGRAGCASLAKELCTGTAFIGSCPVCTKENRDEIAKVLGLAGSALKPKRSYIACAGNSTISTKYLGIEDCVAAHNYGCKDCTFGCCGYYTCVKVCVAGAMQKSPNGYPIVNADKCTGCGTCAKACPRKLITVRDADISVYIGCSNINKGKAVKEICSNGCIGCGLCAKICPSNTIKMVANLPVFEYDKCISCGACIEKCPQKCLINN